MRVWLLMFDWAGRCNRNGDHSCLILLHTTNCTLNRTNWTMNTKHWTLNTAHCTLHTAYCTLYTTHWTLHCTLHTAHCTLHNENCKLHSAHCTLHTAHYTMHTVKNQTIEGDITNKAFTDSSPWIQPILVDQPIQTFLWASSFKHFTIGSRSKNLMKLFYTALLGNPFYGKVRVRANNQKEGSPSQPDHALWWTYNTAGSSTTKEQ